MADESGGAKRYKTARALEMALKEAARKSGRDVSRAMADFWHGRLLERVFSEDDPSFVLKGGRGMLARTPSARYTRDTDGVCQWWLKSGNSKSNYANVTASLLDFKALTQCLIGSLVALYV